MFNMFLAIQWDRLNFGNIFTGILGTLAIIAVLALLIWLGYGRGKNKKREKALDDMLTAKSFLQNPSNSGYGPGGGGGRPVR